MHGVCAYRKEVLRPAGKSRHTTHDGTASSAASDVAKSVQLGSLHIPETADNACEPEDAADASSSRKNYEP